MGVPFFALVQTGEPVLGWAPMIAVQPARYTGFATSRELGAAIAGFSPLISVALLDRGGPHLVAAFFFGLAVISFVAFLFSRETKDVDIGEPVAQPEPVLST